MAAIDPIHQFRIHDIVPIHIGGLNLSFTNASLFMALTVVAATARRCVRYVSEANPAEEWDPASFARREGGSRDPPFHQSTMR